MKLKKKNSTDIILKDKIKKKYQFKKIKVNSTKNDK